MSELPAWRTQLPSGRSPKGESGQALLELALVVHMLVLLVMAIFQFAFVLQSQVGLTNAVREAARRVVATENPAPTWTGPGSVTEWTQRELCGDLTLPCDGGLLHQNVQGFDGTRLWVDPPPVTFCTYQVVINGIAETQLRVHVDVKYKHPLFFLPMAFATDLVDGSQNDAWDLSAAADMRMENVDETDPAYTPPPPPQVCS